MVNGKKQMKMKKYYMIMKYIKRWLFLFDKNKIRNNELESKE